VRVSEDNGRPLRWSPARRGSEAPEVKQRATGPRPPKPSRDDHEPLTRREREVLNLFAEGLGTAEIARRLSISSVTVRNYAQRILAKLGVHSRLAAVARGYTLRLIPALPWEDRRLPD
jgi:DNA-binding NarL/FixJ family response regulator